MIQRSDVVPDLIEFFMEEYRAAMRHYETEDQVEFTNHLLHVVGINIAGQEEERAEGIHKDLEILKKKYGKQFKHYEKAGLDLYFKSDRVLIEKDLYNEFADLPVKKLTEQERAAFFKKVYTHLDRYLSDLKLILKVHQQNGIIIKETSKIKLVKRRPTDTMTSLNKLQTALLIHYLQKEDVLLKDEFLHNTRAGAAFEILTGYNRGTMTLYLGKDYLEHSKNKKNLKRLKELFIRLKEEIDKELKEKNKNLKKL